MKNVGKKWLRVSPIWAIMLIFPNDNECNLDKMATNITDQVSKKKNLKHLGENVFSIIIIRIW